MRNIIIILLFLVLICGCSPPIVEDWFAGYEKINNPKAINVPYNELFEFLAKDVTNEHDYIIGEYMCVQFATDLHNRAEAYGIRCAIIQSPNKGHALNAFKTTDNGLVFVDASVHSDLPFKSIKPDPKLFHYYW